jgi:hypothetical protein
MESRPDDDDRTGRKKARQLIGCITEEFVGEDMAGHHDRYIHRRAP